MSRLKLEWARPLLMRSSVIFTMIAGLVVAPLSAAGAAPGPGGFDFGVRPWASDGAPARSAFTFDVAPGQPVSDRVELVNSGDQPKAFYVYAADAYTTEIGGGFALHLRTDPARDAAAWTLLPVSQYTVPARSAAIVPFQVTVPPDATPGDHTGAVVAEEILPAAPAGQRAGVVPVHRVAARIYLRVQGPVHPALQIERLTVTRHEPVLPGLGRSSTTVTFSLVNAGNVRTQLDEIDFHLTGAFGRTLRTVKLARPTAEQADATSFPDQVIPGSRLQFSRTFEGLPPIEAITAAVSVRAEDSLLHQPVSTSRSTTFWVVPWLAVGLLLALVGLVVALRRWRRRSGSRPSGPSDPSGSSGPSGPAGPAPDDVRVEVLVGS